eukprot:SAG31_NODE_6282_length_2088_cov_1.201106_1_plen_128_part_00
MEAEAVDPLAVSSPAAADSASTAAKNQDISRYRPVLFVSRRLYAAAMRPDPSEHPDWNLEQPLSITLRGTDANGIDSTMVLPAIQMLKTERGHGNAKVSALRSKQMQFERGQIMPYSFRAEQSLTVS